MKLECQVNKLKSAIAIAERLTGKNLSLPALARIYLEASERTLLIRATNLDLGLEWHLPAKVEKGGKVLINGAVLNNLLTNLSSEDKVRLELTGDNLTVVAPRHTALVKTYPLEDFPTLPLITAGATLSLDASELLHGLRAVAYAAALNDIKPEIASVYLHTDGASLILAATDSFRLAEQKLPLNEKPKSNLKLIIPIRNISECLRILEQLSGAVTLNHDTHQLNITGDQILFTSRLIDGVFPDYRQLIPAKTTTQATLAKNELMTALRLANIFTDRLNHITCQLRPDEQILEIESRSGEVGEHTSLLPAAITGEALTVSLNARYVLEGLQSINTDKVFWQFNGRTKPLVLTGLGETNFTYLIMPLNR